MSTSRNSIIEKTSQEVLAETFQRGDRTSIGTVLHVPPQHVDEWPTGARRNPWEAAALATEAMRSNGNAHADEPFLWLARVLGYVAIRSTIAATNDAGFAKLLRELSDVVETRAAAQSDGEIDACEHRAIAERLAELIECATAYRLDQLAQAVIKESSIPLRRVR